MDLLSNRPIREGIRGGRGEFSWEKVKNDKYRENYLGHSLMAPTGRGSSKTDALWYSREKSTELNAEEGTDNIDILDSNEKRLRELRVVKEAEERAMAEALGLPYHPKTHNDAASGNSSDSPRNNRDDNPKDRDRLYRRDLRRDSSDDKYSRRGGEQRSRRTDDRDHRHRHRHHNHTRSRSTSPHSRNLQSHGHHHGKHSSEKYSQRSQDYDRDSHYSHTRRSDKSVPGDSTTSNDNIHPSRRRLVQYEN
ncbi:kinase phosphorylation protein-domain-containing protein [Dipodascopsis uninucleata]